MAVVWGDLGSVSFAVAGVINILLAVLLLIISYDNRLHRTFALLLALRGILNFSAGDASALADKFGNYARIGLPFAAIYFGSSYWLLGGAATSRRSRRMLRLIGIGLLVSAVSFELAWFLSGLSEAGAPWLGAFVGSNVASYGCLSLLFAWGWRRAIAPLHRRSLLLLSVGFALNPLDAATDQILTMLDGPGSFFAALADLTVADSYALWGFVNMAALGGTIVLLIGFRMRSEDATERAALVRGLLLLMLPVTLIVASRSPLVADSPRDFLEGITSPAMIVLLALTVLYALLRYRLFGLDLRLRWTVKQGTFGAILLGTFFAVSETVKDVFADQLGPALGIIAAGALFFVFSPLQRFAERVAASAVPDAKPTSSLASKERLDIYREQVRAAWADGVLTAKDMRILEVARQRLAITPHQAQGIERDIIGAYAPRTRGAPSRVPATPTSRF